MGHLARRSSEEDVLRTDVALESYWPSENRDEGVPMNTRATVHAIPLSGMNTIGMSVAVATAAPLTPSLRFNFIRASILGAFKSAVRIKAEVCTCCLSFTV